MSGIFPVYVGHIPSEATVADLRRIFGRVGHVLEVIIVSEHGFVNYDSESVAVEAIRRYNGHLLHGTPIHVDYSEELADFLRKSGKRFAFTEDPWTERKRSHGRQPSPVASRRTSSSTRRSRSPPRRRQPSSPSTSRQTSSSGRSRSPQGRSRDRRSRSPCNRRRHSREVEKSEGRQRSPPSPWEQPQQQQPLRQKSRSPTEDVREPAAPRKGLLVEELGEDKKVDLRSLLSSRKTKQQQPEQSALLTPLENHIGGGSRQMSIKVKINAKDEEREIHLGGEAGEVGCGFVGCQEELYVGNLLNEVESSDLVRLLEAYGTVVHVSMQDTHAIVHLDCSPEAAENAITTLDRNLWMDNNIRVKQHGDKRLPRRTSANNEQHCDRVSANRKTQAEDEEDQQPRGPRQKVVDSEMIDKFLRSQRQVDQSSSSKDRKLRVRILVVQSQTMPKSFLADMSEVFSRFGRVEYCSVNPDGVTVCLGLMSSEWEAIQCVGETNKVQYKGGRLKVKFLDGTEEDSIEFRRRYPVELVRNYPEVLQAVGYEAVTTNSSIVGGAGELPIGVLPPSSSLGAFGAVPNRGELTSIIRNARAMMSQAQKAPVEFQPQVAPRQTVKLREDPQYVSDVEGVIHSVHNKIILVQFHTGFSVQIAKLIPGQMFVNGRTSLGVIIKNNTFHTWPQDVQGFLYQGSQVKMDARRMSELEVADTQEITAEQVRYSTPLVWRGQKPDNSDITISAKLEAANDQRRQKVQKAVVAKLFPKWGLLRTLDGGIGGSGEGIFFEVQQYFNKTSLLTKDDTLLNYLTVGDVLAVQSRRKDYLEMAEIARRSPGFTGGADGLHRHARLVWQITTEVDPIAHKPTADEQSSEQDQEETFRFLATSSTLNCQLPAERDATHRGWTGVIEEIYLPAGGIILLNESSGLDIARRRVYFHRSRIFLNGAKVTSNTSLDAELAVDDPVTVDVIVNAQDPDAMHSSPPYVFSAAGAYWVALSVQVNTRNRGARIARAIRDEGSSDDEPVKNVPEEGSPLARGRIIHFGRPEQDGEAVSAGTAVIDTGPFAGQRVEFERRQCQAFGFPLAKADLSQIFSFGESVFIQVKPYNSFCVENLFVGFKSSAYRESGLSPDERLQMKGYLISHGLDFSAFDNLVNGKFSARPFIPLPAQPYKGRIRSLRSTRADRSANLVVIELDLNIGGGDVIKLEARREDVFVFGHWMGKADLRYILDDEEVFVEYVPQLDRPSDEDGPSSSGAGGVSAIRASIVWLGDEDDRPFYHGQANRAHITAKMDSALWQFVRSKQMDEKMFRALVEGRLPPKEPEISVTVADGTTISLDQETLAQAALLKQMKTQFGSDACLKAMMMLMARGGAGTEAFSSEMQRMMAGSEASAEATPSSNEQGEDGRLSKAAAVAVSKSRISFNSALYSTENNSSDQNNHFHH